MKNIRNNFGIRYTPSDIELSGGLRPRLEEFPDEVSDEETDEIVESEKLRPEDRHVENSKKNIFPPIPQ